MRWKKKLPRLFPLPGVLVFLTLLLAGHGTAAAQDLPTSGACQQSLWGCPPKQDNGDASAAPTLRYERLLSAARSAAGMLRPGMPGDLEAAARLLAEATELLKDAPEAYSLLGQLDLERGLPDEAEPALHRAAELLLASETATSAPASIERLDPPLALALGLLSAQKGDLFSALERYLRLLRVTAPSHRLLYRIGDVLMALGRLNEATAFFERACTLQRSLDMPSFDVARACAGYLVALDRGERIFSAAALRRLKAIDRDMQLLRYHDFLTPWERDYYLALVLPPSPCQRREAFLRYLRGAQSSGEQKSSPRYVPPLSYLRRAEAHLQKLAALSCP
jgi:tetratricopeptide (TPR) repeat protein